MTPRLGMTERELQDSIVQMARLNGWLVHHSRPAVNRNGKWATHIQGDVGLPDLLMCKPPRFVIVELKSERGRLSPHQRVWIDALRACDVDVRVWYPRDLEDAMRLLSGTEAA